MPNKIREMKEKTKEYFAGKQITRDHETSIAMFLSQIMLSNITVFSKIEFQTFEWQIYKHIHSQFFKDYQLTSLLLKYTSWSNNPFVYLKSIEFNQNLWQNASLDNYLSGLFEKDKKFFRYLALSHAFKSEIRFIPLLPTDLKLDTPFLNALHDIATENGKEIQTQIYLLKNINFTMTNEEKEEIVSEQRNIVRSHFCDFLEYLITL